MTSKIAFIREAECIGCIKCIKACSDNAILGARKQMHTIITDLCTGCEDCIAVCPVDCIEMVPSLFAARGNPGSEANVNIEPGLPRYARNDGDKKDLIAEAVKRTLARRGWKSS
jgi:RnfABCDGE-type electron transport complex B subunit